MRTCITEFTWVGRPWIGNYAFPLLLCECFVMILLCLYCLDGPVVFTEDVTWFCEDCDPTAVETFSYDKSACPPSRASDSLDLEDAIQTRMEETNCTRQVEERNKFKKECQATLKDTANSFVETVPVENSHVADLNLVDSEDNVVAQPIDDPIWRGSLHLRNGSIDSIWGLSAHLSDLACSRVSEKTRLFPKRLSMDLLQRHAVWPNLFSKDGTDRDSIALYFFPDERSERDFYKLVDDIIHSDLAMRAVLEHVELLIFPSTTLPIEYRRINAKYYLWGVFKSNKSSSNTK
ncbi:hypothetical protein PIB30_098737 [Stylosanthes scabra]|uniref:AIPP2-like SPOC-like domain-containing protein n=2 Tax=Stylosanthes scabra TaxID=79078 RepID=A0ABU6ZVH6_9FABA|nr:hypothetical protein [Stylosanthes scabra]